MALVGAEVLHCEKAEWTEKRKIRPKVEKIVFIL